MIKKIANVYISKLYKIFGIINLGLSILFIIFIKENLVEGISVLLFMNLYYHLSYFAFIMFSENSLVKKTSKEKPIRIIFKIFVGAVIIISFLYPFKELYSSIVYNNYSELFMIFIQVGLFLGAISFWFSLKQE